VFEYDPNSDLSAFKSYRDRLLVLGFQLTIWHLIPSKNLIFLYFWLYMCPCICLTYYYLF